MVDHSKSLKASKFETTLLVLFIPSRDREERPIDQQKWADEAEWGPKVVRVRWVWL